MKWITPLPLNSHDSGEDLQKTGARLIKGCLAVNLSGVMTALEEVEKGGVILAVACFIEDGLIHSILTPP